MNFHLPTTPEEWEELNRLLLSFYEFAVPPSAHIIIWLVTIVGPIPGLLYLISAVKACQTNGWWLVKVDERGYLYPHNRPMLAIWINAFTIVNLAHSASLLIDTRSHLHPRTVIFHLTSYCLLSCLAWAKVWGLFYAMPPSRYRFARANQKTGISLQRPIPAYLFNPLIISAHLVSIFGGLGWIILIIKESYKLVSLFNQYQVAYASMSIPYSTPSVRMENELKALITLNNMRLSVGIVQKNLKNVCAFLLATIVVQLIVSLWCSNRILAALFFQARTLREAASRQVRLRTQPAQVDFGWSHSSEPESLIKIASAPLQPRSGAGSYGGTISDKKIFRHRWRDFLPSLNRGNVVSSKLWNSESFQRTQEQIMADGAQDMSACYRKLRRYAINTFWNMVLTSAVKSSYLILCILIVVGVFDYGSSVFQMELAVFEWLNITWNCGVGFLLAVYSCIVVFTPTPVLPHEPTTREEDVTDDNFS